MVARLVPPEELAPRVLDADSGAGRFPVIAPLFPAAISCCGLDGKRPFVVQTILGVLLLIGACTSLARVAGSRKQTPAALRTRSFCGLQDTLSRSGPSLGALRSVCRVGSFGRHILPLISPAPSVAVFINLVDKVPTPALRMACWGFFFSDRSHVGMDHGVRTDRFKTVRMSFAGSPISAAFLAISQPRCNCSLRFFCC
jgi:hypothetical protein